MASSMLKLTPNNFEPELLTLEEPMKNGSRSNVFSARLKYDGQNFLIQAPKLQAPFGASKYEDNFSLTLAMKDSNKKELDFKNFLDTFSKRVETLISKLGNKKLAKCSKNFTSMVKLGKLRNEDDESEGRYDDKLMIKLKFNQESGELFADVYNRDGDEFVKKNVNEMTVEKEIPRSFIRSLLMTRVWFVSSKCGVTINARQLLVYPTKTQGCMFKAADLSDDDDEEETTTGPTQVDESDDEEED